MKVGLNGAPIAVCVGRLCEQKGQDVLLDAWPAVLEEVPDAELVLVGDGPDRPALESVAPPGVRFAGVRDDVADWLAAADVVVQPSRWEGMSIVMLEAMACGRSIVMSDVDGAREAIRGSGAIVPIEDPRATAAAVAERLADPLLTAREGERGRERAEALHTFEDAADAIADVYDEVLEGEPLVGAPVPVFAGAGRETAGARS